MTQSVRSVVDSLQRVTGAGAREFRSGVDATVHGRAPIAVVEPESAEAGAGVLTLCSSEGWYVEPVGGGTWTGWGRPPAEPFITLSTRRIAGLEAYEPEDLTVTAGAGTTFTELAAALAARGQWLALDPPMLGGATVGAMVATASAGPLRARFGTPRDHVLGLDIATGDGRLLHFGGKVVKNVAGYDIVRPVTGSFGALGVITRVSLRLRPRPATDETIALAVPEADAVSIAGAIDNAWPVAAIELISPWLAVDVVGAAGAHPEWTLLVRLHGHPAEVAEARHRIASLPGGLEALQLPPGLDPWAALSRSEAAANPCYRLAAKVTRLAETIEIANRLSDHVLAGPPHIAVHAADGIVRVWGTAADAAAPEGVARAAQEMVSIDGTLRCLVSSLRLPEPDGRRAALDRGIRALFDPAGILTGARL
jgi:glycolate oxidase FAD binding subunit